MKARRCVIHIIGSLILALMLSSSEFISPVGVAGAPLVATCTPDPPGESDNISDALTVCEGQTVTGRVDDNDDDDVYKIYVLANQTITLSMSGTGVGGPGDADLYLYPPGSTDVYSDPAADVSDSLGNDEFIQHTASQEGFWYIDVFDCCFDDGGTDYSVTVTLSGSGGSAPVAPSNLTATSVSQTQINLLWQDNSTDETGFNIERSPNGSTGWTQVATVAANATTYTNTSLLCGTTYYYRVQATNSAGGSAYSNISNATTSTCSGTAPAAPSNLAATPVSQTQINLSWQDNSTDETGFIIERSPNGFAGWTQIAAIGANATTYTNSSLLCGTTYYYRVQAINSGGTSVYSNIQGAETLSCPAIFLPIILNIPPPPSSAPILSPVSNPDGSRNFGISWSSVNGATDYILQQDDNSSFSNPSIAYSGISTSTTVIVEGVGTYYYRVQAANSSGNGPWSNIVSVDVTQDAVVPLPGHWSGSTVAFDVTSDSGTVQNFSFDVDVSGCGTYTFTKPDVTIANGQFSTGGLSGQFSTPTSASGDYSYAFQACNAFAFGFGSWSATWKYSSAEAETYETANPGQKHKRDKTKAKGRR